MIALSHFNLLAEDAARALLQPCVAIPAWTQALAAGRPYADLSALHHAARELTQAWGRAELEQALSAHPRIGEKPTGAQRHAALSRQEQASVNADDAALAQALKAANARYEARFGRIFLIRAKGRSGEEILQALAQRLTLSDAEETARALGELRDITLLRLEGTIGQ